MQTLAEESQVRLEMQMSLDSKDSDIERLRCQITSLSIHSLDTTSISSTGNDLEGDDAYPGNYPGYDPSSTGQPNVVIHAIINARDGLKTQMFHLYHYLIHFGQYNVLCNLKPFNINRSTHCTF